MVVQSNLRGRINSKYNKHRDKYRIRLSGVHPDQYEVIMAALAKARIESDTEYDSVALTNSCVHYMGT